MTGTDGENGIRVIPGVIDPSIGTVSVLLINSSDRPYKMNGDTLLGIACPTFCNSVSTTPKSAPELSEYHNDEECGVLPEHLSHLLDSVNGLTEMETVKVRSLLLKYQTLFAISNSDLGRTDAAQHRIRTKHDNPIRAKTNVYMVGIIWNRLRKLLIVC